jgi:hypothetical protein
MFAEPVDPERDEAPGYFDIIKRPMDFSTIRRRLQNNEYATVHDWKEEVQLIFSNACAYNGKASPIGAIAIELQSQFRELAKTIVEDETAAWLNELTQLRKELCDHVGTRAGTIAQKRPIVVEPGAEIRRFLVNSMTKEDLEKLAVDLARMEEEEQIEQIGKIIQKGNPEVGLGEGATVDLNLLAPQTLRELKEFVVGEMRARGDLE